MTRTEQIEAAKAFTEKHKDSHRVFLEDGYIEASARELNEKGLGYLCQEVFDSLDFIGAKERDDFEIEYNRTRIWAIDQNRIATTDFIWKANSI